MPESYPIKKSVSMKPITRYDSMESSKPSTLSEELVQSMSDEDDSFDGSDDEMLTTSVKISSHKKTESKPPAESEMVSEEEYEASLNELNSICDELNTLANEDCPDEPAPVKQSTAQPEPVKQEEVPVPAQQGVSAADTLEQNRSFFREMFLDLLNNDASFRDEVKGLLGNQSESEQYQSQDMFQSLSTLFIVYGENSSRTLKALNDLEQKNQLIFLDYFQSLHSEFSIIDESISKYIQKHNLFSTYFSQNTKNESASPMESIFTSIVSGAVKSRAKTQFESPDDSDILVLATTEPVLYKDTSVIMVMVYDYSQEVGSRILEYALIPTMELFKHYYKKS